MCSFNPFIVIIEELFADMEQSAKHTSFSDVAGAWFLAGFQTSRLVRYKISVFPMIK